MQLIGTSVVLVVVDGVRVDEVVELKRGLEDEGALVLLATPQAHVTVEAVGRDGIEELVVDLPLEAVEEYEFEGLLLPSGSGRTEEREAIERLVRSFKRQARPVFLSDPESVFPADGAGPGGLVRDAGSRRDFIDRMVAALGRYGEDRYYRLTMAS